MTSLTGKDRYLWAKSQSKDGDHLHPLILHLIDVAACADANLAREPEITRNRLTGVIGPEWSAVRLLLLLLAACHDLGKGCPGFQFKWKNPSGMDDGASPNAKVHHASVSQVEIQWLLIVLGWPEKTSGLVGDAVGCHHGEWTSSTTLDPFAGNRCALGKPDWNAARRALFETLIADSTSGAPPAKPAPPISDFMLLASFADWIGSNEAFFPFGVEDECDDPAVWLKIRLEVNADNALDQPRCSV